jgi:Transposase IS66 family
LYNSRHEDQKRTTTSIDRRTRTDYPRPPRREPATERRVGGGKKISARPEIKPSRLGKEKDEAPKRRGSQKVSKELVPDEIITLAVDTDKLPVGSVFKGYREFLVQDLEIKRRVIKYRRAFYEVPDGGTIVAELPKDLNDQHFGTTLRAFILTQYHANNVPQPKIRQTLTDLGIQISSGEINNIILDAAQEVAKEYEGVRVVGLQTAKNIGVDDTGARHDGKNGSCLVIQNEFFAFFRTTSSKSRMNFLTTLRGLRADYVLNNVALAYIKQYKPKKEILEILKNHVGIQRDSLEQFQNFLLSIGITNLNTGQKMRLAIEEAAVLGSAIQHSVNPDMKIISDAAGQFELFVLTHALCWIHVERAFKKLVPAHDDERAEIEQVRDDIWAYYRLLKQYKENPDPALKGSLSAQFDQLCKRSVESLELAAALKRMHDKKNELLVVLDHPDVPLHNNATESAIRCYRIKQKISGPTRSDAGKYARDIFASLIKTCRKLGISAWEFMCDRIGKFGKVPYLPDLIRARTAQKQASPAPPA